MTEDDNRTPTLAGDACNIAGNMRTKSLQRQQIITSMYMLKTNLNEFHQMTTYQLEVKLGLLERQFQSFEKLQMELESFDEYQFNQNHRYLVEGAYFEVKSVILEQLGVHRSNLQNSPLSSTRVVNQPPISNRPVLPTLQLSKFSGNYKDWMEFYNVFRLLVHDNEELSPVSKFQYLKSCLTDSAARLIQSLEVKANNYNVAFELLEKRFNNKNQLVHSHLLEIFNVQKVVNPSVSSLWSFIDKINASMRALETIATKQQIADSIILHLVCEFLLVDAAAPSELHLTSWGELATFLEKRCKLLEVSESSHTFTKRTHSTKIKPHVCIKI